ncbi:prepilin peptidase [Pelagirhabdus alkalitolerans]|nr:A24 family peptidase [Pelagirhabdus alkalitolerans]
MFGLIIGSFLNVVILRLPKNKSIAYPPSHCQTCHKELTPIELIPLFSYLFLRGRCKGCGVRISPRYSLIELLNGLIYILILSVYGIQLETFFALGLASLLIVVTFIDLDHLLIPNKITSTILIWVVTESVVQLASNQISITIMLDRFYGLLLGGGLFLIIAIITKGAMGGGDIKLMGALGYYFGLTHTLGLIFFSFTIGGVLSIALVALKVKSRKDVIPFGPFICLAAFVMLIYGEHIINWYTNLS